MSEQRKFRGGERPKDALTLEEAMSLPGLRGKNHMTVRRALEPVRLGEWLPEGARHWRVLYQEAAVKEIAAAFDAGRENPYRPRPRCKGSSRPPRPRSTVPRGPREGWATSDQIQLELYAHNIDGSLVSPRWIRTRLLARGVPSERCLSNTGRIQRAFPLEAAVAALKNDELMQDRIRGYRLSLRTRARRS